MSTLKVNKLRDTAGSADAITLDPNGGAVLAGVTTVSTVKVGSGVTITSDGDIFHTGVCTATSFAGQIPAASIVGVCTSGLTKTGGFGKILQVVQNSYSTQATLNSTSYVDTGLTATITPSSTSSKVLIVGFLSFTTSHFASPYNVYGFGCNIVRGSTEIKAGDTGQYYQAIADSDISYTVFNQPHQPIFLDSPNTTSATTYKIQAKESDVNANLTINASSQTSELILMEVAA